MHFRIIYILLCTCLSSSLYSTSILTPQDLGSFSRYAPAIVSAKLLSSQEMLVGNGFYRTQYNFQVMTPFKGELSSGEYFTIHGLSMYSQSSVLDIAGDLHFTEGRDYMLFLQRSNQHNWQPLILAWGIFEYYNKGQISYLVPVKESFEYFITNDQQQQILQVYQSHVFHRALYDVLTLNKRWDKNLAERIAPHSFYSSERAAPGHCTFFGSKPRWTNFPSIPAKIRAGVSGDPSFSGANTQVANALANLTSAYFGINYSYAGTHNYSPNCIGGSAATGNFQSYIFNNYGSARNGLVIYNDPCNEMSNLNNCIGPLAFGGVYGSGSHTFDGTTWINAQYPFVIINNGVGPCLGATGYRIMVTHELTHGLCLNHIASTHGQANMNPSCCIEIKSLDIQCINYLYPPGNLPLDLTSFYGTIESNVIHLHWSTQDEQDHSHFIIEKSTSGKDFTALDQITTPHSQHQGNNYLHIDRNPNFGNNYYRLKQVDVAGTFSYSQIIDVEYIDQWDFTMQQNPNSTSNLNYTIYGLAGQQISLNIYDLQGKLLLQTHQVIKHIIEHVQLNVPNLQNTVVITQLTSKLGTKSKRKLF